MIMMMIRRDNIFRIRSVNFALFLYAFFGLLAMLINESLPMAIKYYLIMIGPVWFYAVLSDGLKNNKNVERILKILFFCGLLFCLQTFYFHIRSERSLIEEQSIITSAGNVISFGSPATVFVKEGEEYVKRSRGVLNVEQGNYCGMLAPLVLFGLIFFIYSRRKSRFIYLAGSLLMSAQIIDTMSRSGIATLIIGLAVLSWYLFHYERKWRIQLVVLVLALVASCIVYITVFDKMFIIIRFLHILNNMFELPSFLQEYLVIIQHSDKTDPHVVAMADGMKIILANPFFGAGYILDEAIQVHNRYLFILASSGIYTLIAYLLFILGLFVSIRKTMLNYKPLAWNNINYVYLFLAVTIAFLFKLFNQGQELYYYWIIFALASAWIRNIKREKLIEAGCNGNA
jgi:hypothetical protein